MGRLACISLYFSCEQFYQCVDNVAHAAADGPVLSAVAGGGLAVGGHEGVVAAVLYNEGCRLGHQQHAQQYYYDGFLFHGSSGFEVEHALRVYLGPVGVGEGEV